LFCFILMFCAFFSHLFVYFVFVVFLFSLFKFFTRRFCFLFSWACISYSLIIQRQWCPCPFIFFFIYVFLVSQRRTLRRWWRSGTCWNALVFFYLLHNYSKSVLRQTQVVRQLSEIQSNNLDSEIANFITPFTVENWKLLPLHIRVPISDRIPMNPSNSLNLKNCNSS